MELKKYSIVKGMLPQEKINQILNSESTPIWVKMMLKNLLFRERDEALMWAERIAFLLREKLIYDSK